MYKCCVSKQSAARQAALEEQLLKLMLRRPYPELTVSEFCREAGISRKIFYRYFTDKNGALCALIDHTLERFNHYVSTQSAASETTLEEGLLAMFTFWREQQPLLDALDKGGLMPVFYDRAQSQSSDSVSVWGLTFPAVGSDMNLQTVAFVMGGLMSMILLWHSHGYRESTEQMTSMASSMLRGALYSGGE